MKEKGVILYRGPSVLDGAPIVVIATLKSSNAKTGDMVQVFILREDIHPVEALQSGQDVSICGSCAHRPILGGACYVNVGQAPSQVWKSYKRGIYRDCSDLDNGEQAAIVAHLFSGRAVRLGAYGDPGAVPFEVFEQALQGAAFWTGYTHQTRHANFDARLLRYCMASADTPRQALKLQAMGARTFRVKTPDANFLPGEIECLADAEGFQCIECGLCDGKGKAPNVAINVHGAKSARYINKFSNANIIARA